MLRSHFKVLCRSYSEVFFLNSIGVGFVILILSLGYPNIAIAGLISTVSGYLFARLIRMNQEYLGSGFYTYNPLLVGLSIGYLFKISSLTVAFLIFAGILTFAVTATLVKLFHQFLQLPVLSLPFVVVSSLVYLASSKYTSLYVQNLNPHYIPQWEQLLPIWVAGFFRALGAILFMPHVFPGIILALVIIASSRILFFLAVSGYFLGTFATIWLSGSYVTPFSDIQHFNFILIAMALGGIFLVPSLKSYTIAAVAVLCSTLLLDSSKMIWSAFSVPVFTLPFNLTTLLMLYLLETVKFKFLTKQGHQTPESALDHFQVSQKRFPGSWNTISLPFSGAWSVLQAFDGPWTHQGSLKHACDFIIKDDSGESFRNEGLNLEDYYAFKKPVSSPIQGRVTKVISHIPDNPPGKPNHNDHWGNLVILHDPRGFYVEISHFAKDSLVIKEGQWVERGTLLGYCGNSGYSPYPHIHVQAQASGEVGSYTIPFSFVNFKLGSTVQSNTTLEEDQVVTPLPGCDCLDTGTSFTLDQEFSFDVLDSGQSKGTWSFVVKMAPDGNFYFDTPDGQLYFGKFENTYFHYRLEGNDPYLACLFKALPRLPLLKLEHLSWEDHLPIAITVPGFRKEWYRWVSSVLANWLEIRTTLTFDGNIIKGEIRSNKFKKCVETEMELDCALGFHRFKVDSLEFIRRDLAKT